MARSYRGPFGLAARMWAISRLFTGVPLTITVTGARHGGSGLVAGAPAESGESGEGCSGVSARIRHEGPSVI